jgi:acetyl-CoA carboxylase biotin carboxyl carrier protein
MNEKYIRKLIRLVEESEIDSLEVSSWGRKIRITQKGSNSSNGHNDAPPVIHSVIAPAQVMAASAAAPVGAPVATPPTATAVSADNKHLVEIKSPMVGTFYAAPSPDSPPYVSQNERITVGQVVCIVEAMKLMNEIESEVSGSVSKILVENGKPVEFGQVLFLIDPAG